MTFPEADLVPLSALQHYIFCLRHCALLHLEQIREESRLTVEERIQHGRVEQSGAEAVTRSVLGPVYASG